MVTWALPGLLPFVRLREWRFPRVRAQSFLSQDKGEKFPPGFFFFFFFAEFRIFTCSRSRRRLFSLIYPVFGLSCDCVPYEKDFLVAFLLALPLLHIVYTELKRDWRVTLRPDATELQLPATSASRFNSEEFWEL